MNERDEKQKQGTGSGQPADDPHGSEREADSRRPGGPRYHGAGWERADEESERGPEPVDLPRADDPVRVDPGAVPGSKGRNSRS